MKGVDDGDVTYEQRGSTAWITLANVARANALTPTMVERLEASWQRAEADAAIRVLVITGAGDRHFCAGADQRALADGRMAGLGTRLTSLQNGVTKPVIAAVNGVS